MSVIELSNITTGTCPHDSSDKFLLMNNQINHVPMEETTLEHFLLINVHDVDCFGEDTWLFDNDLLSPTEQVMQLYSEPCMQIQRTNEVEDSSEVLESTLNIESPLTSSPWTADVNTVKSSRVCKRISTTPQTVNSETPHRQSSIDSRTFTRSKLRKAFAGTSPIVPTLPPSQHIATFEQHHVLPEDINTTLEAQQNDATFEAKEINTTFELQHQHNSGLQNQINATFETEHVNTTFESKHINTTFESRQHNSGLQNQVNATFGLNQKHTITLQEKLTLSAALHRGNTTTKSQLQYNTLPEQQLNTTFQTEKQYPVALQRKLSATLQQRINTTFETQQNLSATFNLEGEMNGGLNNTYNLENETTPKANLNSTYNCHEDIEPPKSLIRKLSYTVVHKDEPDQPNNCYSSQEDMLSSASDSSLSHRALDVEDVHTMARLQEECLNQSSPKRRGSGNHRDGSAESMSSTFSKSPHGGSVPSVHSSPPDSPYSSQSLGRQPIQLTTREQQKPGSKISTVHQSMPNLSRVPKRGMYTSRMPQPTISNNVPRYKSDSKLANFTYIPQKGMQIPPRSSIATIRPPNVANGLIRPRPPARPTIAQRLPLPKQDNKPATRVQSRLPMPRARSGIPAPTVRNKMNPDWKDGCY